MKRFILLVLLVSFQAQAGTSTGVVEITKIRTGWNSGAIAIEVNQTVINPAGCATPDGYAIQESSNGFQTHYSAALAAYVAGKPVEIIVATTECEQSRPKIWGIYF